MALTFYKSVAKGLKLKVRKFLGANSFVYRSHSGKIGRGPFCPHILNRVKGIIVLKCDILCDFYPGDDIRSKVNLDYADYFVIAIRCFLKIGVSVFLKYF